MAITCPRCGSQFDATLFQFGHQVRCGCEAEIAYPGADERAGHVIVEKAGENDGRENDTGTQPSLPPPSRLTGEST